MRLELEQSTSASPLPENSIAENPPESNSAELNEFLKEGIDAAQAGSRSVARILLTRVTEMDPKNESAWLWLASISEYPEELLRFLNNVLEINPENERALQWEKATKVLLAKTFVQHGIDASRDDRTDAAIKNFKQALDYDENNEMAWLWMASLADSDDEKIANLERVLSINPENEAAQTALKSTREQISRMLLKKANSAAVAGEREKADEMLDEIFAQFPDSEAAWVLKSHLSDSFDEKIKCFERVLEINPDNLTARAGLDSLYAIMDTVAPNVEQPQNNSSAIEEENVSAEDELPPFSYQPVIDEIEHHSPTGDLVPPEAVVEFIEQQAEINATEASEEPFNAEAVPADEQPIEEPEPEIEEFIVAAHVPESAAVEKVQEEFQYEEAQETVEPEAVEFSEVEEVIVDEPAAEIAEVYAPEEINLKPTTETVENTEAEEEADSLTADMQVSQSEEAAENAPMLSDDEMPTMVFEGSINEEWNGHRSGEMSMSCPFCETENDASAFSCDSCNAVLTLRDLDLLLSNESANKKVIRYGVEQMQSAKDAGDFDAQKLSTLAIGHFNLQNFENGFSVLQEAAAGNPENSELQEKVKALAAHLQEERRQEIIREAVPNCKTILVIDDSPTVRKLISGKLEKCGHQVVCADDGDAAMARINEFIPDLVLLDITMPRMDGYEVCKLIRMNDPTKDVPVVMISGKDGFFDKERGEMAGTTGYITKPFGPETLMKTLETYLENGH